MASSFVCFDIDIFVLSDFLFVFLRFCLEAVICSAAGFKFNSLDHIEHVVFKFVEGANMRWQTF